MRVKWSTIILFQRNPHFTLRQVGCVTGLWPAAMAENGKRLVNVHLQSRRIGDSLHL